MLYTLYSYFSGICNNFKARDGTKLETSVCFFVKQKQNLYPSFCCYVQCFGSGSGSALIWLSWFWNRFGNPDPNPGERKLAKIKKNLISSLLKWFLYLRRYFLHMTYYLLYIFLSKSNFLCRQSLTEFRIRKDRHSFGSLDPDPDLYWGKKLDPDTQG